MRLAPALPYITWGLIWEPQNKTGIPDKIYMVIKIKEEFQRKLRILIIIEENKKEEDISSKYI